MFDGHEAAKSIGEDLVPTVFCVDWTEDDELGPKEDGWSLHVTREDAEAFIAGFESPHAGHSGPYLVEVPKQVLEELRATKNGAYYPRPRDCPYPAVRSRE